MKRILSFVQSIATVLVAVALMTTASAQAAITPPTTPVPAPPQGAVGRFVFFPTNSLVSASGAGVSADVSRYSVCGVQYVLTTTLANTATLFFQSSNDRVNWETHNAGFALGITTTHGMAFVNVPVSAYMRVTGTLSNTNPLRLAVTAVCR